MITNNRRIIVMEKPKTKKVKRFSKEQKERFLSKGGDPLAKNAQIMSISKNNKELNKKFAPVLPLKPVMIAALKEKGLEVPKDLAVLSNKFYNEVVRNAYKVGNTKYSSEFKEMDVCSTPIDHADPVKDSIVSGIVTFVKGVKDKKDAGKTLSKVEEAVYNTTKTVEANAEKQAKDEAAKTLGAKILFDPKIRTMLIVVVAIVVISLFVKFPKG